jgi:undecaprenyl pyrophosphate phosphatase UppP
MSFRLLFLLLFALPGLARSQTTVVRGMVYDGDPSVAKKTPLIGANVLLKGTQIGAITDLEGRFELKTDQKLHLTCSSAFISSHRR